MIFIGFTIYPIAFKKPLSRLTSQSDVSSRIIPTGTPTQGVVTRSWIEGDCVTPSIVYSNNALWANEPKAEV